MSLFDQTRIHQGRYKATDEEMMQILCGYITLLDNRFGLPLDLSEYVETHLKQMPKQVAPYNDPRFTEADQSRIIQLIMEELADNTLKNLAHDQVEKEELVDLIGYACEDTDKVARLLHLIQDQEDQDYEGLIDFWDDKIGEEYDADSFLNFANRMLLLENNKVTLLGVEFMERFL